MNYFNAGYGYTYPQYPQQYPQYQQQYQQPQQQYNINNTQGLQGKVLQAENELETANMTFDGTTNYFPIGNEFIYTKQLGLDGNIIVKKYKLVTENKKVENSNNNYVTKEQLEETVTNIINKIFGGSDNATTTTNVSTK